MSDNVTPQVNGDNVNATQPAPPQFSPDQIKTAIAEGFESVNQRQQIERQPTQEEIDEANKVWKPDKGFVEKFRRVLQASDDNPVPDDELLMPFLTMRDSLLNQANARTEQLVKALVDHFENQYGPVKKALMEQNNEKTEKAFFTKYPTLNEHKEIVQAVAAQFAAQKREVKNADEAFELLAKQVETVIKRLKPDFVLGDSTNTPVNSGGTPRVAGLSTGGQGGAGHGSNEPKSGASSIWGPSR